MRWFISWYVTAFLTALVAAVALALDWLSAHEVTQAAEIRAALELPLGWPPQLVIVLSQLACWVLVRLLLVRIFAYVNSEVASSPRGEGSDSRVNRRRSGRGRTAIRLFHNPTGWWLTPYAVFLNIIVWSAQPFEFNLSEKSTPPIPVAVWGLSVLFAATLAAAMATPDKRIPVRSRSVNEDPDLDPLLETPAETAEGESPVLGAA